MAEEESSGLTALLTQLDERVSTELASAPEVVDVGHSVDADSLAVIARRWHKVTDVVAVVADLKNSTKLGTGKWAASTASIYEAATGSVVTVFDRFDANFLQIQGDGVFALFWGERRYARSIAAGITVKTFSETLVKELEAKWPDLVGTTGYKVGMASSRLLVKKIGTPRNPSQQEPIWAGKAVNYATKAAQFAGRHELVVTGSIWDRIGKNDFVAFSCACGDGPSSTIWSDTTIDRLPDGDPDAYGRKLTSKWCGIHGADYCDSILMGKSRRDDTIVQRRALDVSLQKDPVRAKAARERRDRQARTKGLRR